MRGSAPREWRDVGEEGARAAPSIGDRSRLEPCELRARMPRSCDIERSPDFAKNPVEPFLDLIVRETEFKEAVRLDYLASLCIREWLTGVVDAIEFEHQPRFVTAKIGNKPLIGI